MKLVDLVLSALVLQAVTGFVPSPPRLSKVRSLPPVRIFDGGELGTPEYSVLFALTIVPSLAFVKFVGDQADSSRSQMTENQKEKFQRAMMDVGTGQLNTPTDEEEQLKKAIAKAYMEDKDVDVAVLEEKLRQRIAWRKEVMAQAKNNPDSVDEDGW